MIHLTHQQKIQLRLFLATKGDGLDEYSHDEVRSFAVPYGPDGPQDRDPQGVFKAEPKYFTSLNQKEIVVHFKTGPSDSGFFRVTTHFEELKYDEDYYQFREVQNNILGVDTQKWHLYYIEVMKIMSPRFDEKIYIMAEKMRLIERCTLEHKCVALARTIDPNFMCEL